MQSLSSYDLFHIIKELQVLVGGKVEKIFQQDNKEARLELKKNKSSQQTVKTIDDFLFNIHVTGKGKHFLYLSLPQMVCLSSFKPKFPEVPPHFCSALRRKLGGARITAIKQHNFERILLIDFSTKVGNSTLVVELFSSGNMILIDEDKKILSVLHKKIYSEERKLLPAKQFVFPPAQENTLELNKERFTEIIKQSEKDSIVKAVAIDLSLGGTYAQELITRAKLKGDERIQDLKTKEIESLYSALQTLQNEESKPCTVGKEKKSISPIQLQSAKCTIEEKTFNELLADIVLADLEKSEKETFAKDQTKALSKFDKILKSQEFLVKGLEKSEKENQEKGELIYTHYGKIELLLSEINKMRKTKSWKKIKEETKKIPFIKSIDEHKGTITLNLE